MRNNVASLCARVAIVTLASLPVFAVAGGAASAAPSQKVATVHSASAAPTPEQCSAIRRTIEGLKAQRRIAQEELAHATPAEKPALIAEIRELTAEIAELSAELANCPAQG
jgi:hypothetical protein